jgi:transposase-like protein
MTNDIKHKRPRYSLEFKQDAASLVLEKGYSQQLSMANRIEPVSAIKIEPLFQG